MEEILKVEEDNVMIKERNIILDKLKDNVCKAQNKMKKLRDHRRRDVQYI